MASVYSKKINGRTYYYLREMARVDGKPKMVSERYLGTAAEIEAALQAREAASMPERTRHLGFGDLAATWGILARMRVAAIVDEVLGTRRGDAGASVGTYIALAALNRVVAPCAKLAFADWWATTAGDRVTKVAASVLDHRRFWDAMTAISLTELTEIEHRIAVAMIAEFGLDTSALALDMVVLDIPSHPSKRAATCGNATPRRSLTFRVQPRIVSHRLTAAGSKKVCGERWRVTSGPGGSTGASWCAA